MFAPNSTIGSAIDRLKITANDLIQFLKAPTLEPEGLDQPGKIAGTARLFALNCMIVAVIAAILLPIMLALEIEMSNDMSQLFKRPVWQILLFVVVVGPIMEELIFRSWISGSPSLLIPFCGVIIWITGSFIAEQLALTDTNPAIAIILAAILILVGLICLSRFWKNVVPKWYVRFFPWIFWSQAVLFGCVHLFNYAGDNPLALLPFILPQLVGGLIWGYARICYGWWSNIVMHMSYNLIVSSGLIYMLLTQSEAL